MNEVLGFVRVDQDALQLCRTLKAIKSFQPGEVVIREKPLVCVEEDTDAARIMAYLKLNGSQREEFLSVMTEIEMRQKGISVRDTPLQPFVELLEALKEEYGPQVGILSPQEVAGVLLRWRQLRHISPIAVFRTTSKLIHSCSAHVHFRYDEASHLGHLTSSYLLQPQTRIGVWALSDCQLWWKSASMRSEALQKAGFFPVACRCDRCEGSDVVRAVKCPNCEDGEVTRNGRTKRWTCFCCDFSGSDKSCAGFLAIEEKLITDLSNLEQFPIQELDVWAEAVVSRLGPGHWLLASVQLHCYQRALAHQQGEFSFSSALGALQFVEWVISRQLPVPPQELAQQLVHMIFQTLEFLQQRIHGVRDLRVVFLRAVDMMRQPIEAIDRSLVERIRPYSGLALNLRRSCAFCRKRLRDVEEEVEYEMELGDEDGGIVEEIGPVRCLCVDLRYCDLSCQTSDARRHQPYCVSHGTLFRDPILAHVMGTVIGQGRPKKEANKE